MHVRSMKKLRRRNATVTIIGLIVLVTQPLFDSSLSVSAQSQVSFTSKDIFEIPLLNGSIRFAANGTCESAKLEDGVWIFQSFYMSNSRAAEKLNLTISATDCNLIVYPYLVTPYMYGRETLKWVIFSYAVSGSGSQVINLGFNPGNSELDVILDGEFAARNQRWTKSSEGTLTITGSYSNVTLWYIGHPEKTEGVSLLNEHYLVIGSTGFLAVIILLAAIVMHRKKVAEDQ